MITPHSPRAAQIAAVLTAATALSRKVRRTRRAPFSDRRLGRGQLDVLFALAHHRTPVTAGSLAAILQVTAGAVSQLLEPLKAANLVAATANPHDSRSRVLSLTETARAEVERFEQRVVDEVAPVFDDLSDQELKDLADLLGRLGSP
jgi:DNA-binding MarR family transcriptional regulator